MALNAIPRACEGSGVAGRRPRGHRRQRRRKNGSHVAPTTKNAYDTHGSFIWVRRRQLQPLTVVPLRRGMLLMRVLTMPTKDPSVWSAVPLEETSPTKDPPILSATLRSAVLQIEGGRGFDSGASLLWECWWGN